MSMSDPLADMLTRIRNAGMARFDTVDMPHSKLKERLAGILKEEGYILDFHYIEGGGVKKTLKIDLKYDESGVKVISGIKRISKPGRRIYSKFDEIPKVLSGLGSSVISTSHGLMTDRKARSMKIGGEILCNIW